MKKEYVTLPNIITSFRIIGAMILIFLKPLSTLFFIVYTVSGLTDAIDGYVARKTNSVSEFGSKLDSVSDLLFYSIMMIKVMPILFSRLPIEIWYYTGLIVFMRIVVYSFVAIKEKEFHSPHTYLNKASGLLFYLLPFVINTKHLEAYAYAMIGVTFFAAIDEVLIILFKKHVGEKI